MQPDIAHPCCDQLTAAKTGYPLTSITWAYRGLSYRPIEVEHFLKLSADKLLVFKWSRAQVQFYEKHRKSVVFMSRTIKIWISNWFLTREIQPNGQNLTGEFTRKIYAASGNLFTDSWKLTKIVSFRKNRCEGDYVKVGLIRGKITVQERMSQLILPWTALFLLPLSMLLWVLLKNYLLWLQWTKIN